MKIKWNWKLMLMQVLINGLSIALIALLLPGIVLADFRLVSLLLLGVTIGVLNAVVRPVIEFLTLSFIFVTYGLVVIFINTVMLLILAFIFSDMLVIANIWWALLGGALLGVTGLLLESLFGLSPPIIDTSAGSALPDRAVVTNLSHPQPFAAQNHHKDTNHAAPQ